ncbi:hypothetical protein SV7mr_35800 [Stieleria bergensis]|uniref:Uncharacterized protein n=1 Tax=Stieleria bergensis TaxID=2528025 RepID=A0A517SY22_9BACT|nr:hypothetical protein SV7mr_35800 [Planctomycetes bacterium SV_7m_r]
MCWLTGAYSLWVHCLPLEDRLLGCRKFSSIPVISTLLYGSGKGVPERGLSGWLESWGNGQWRADLLAQRRFLSLCLLCCPAWIPLNRLA